MMRDFWNDWEGDFEKFLFPKTPRRAYATTLRSTMMTVAFFLPRSLGAQLRAPFSISPR